VPVYTLDITSISGHSLTVRYLIKAVDATVAAGVPNIEYGKRYALFFGI